MKTSISASKEFFKGLQRFYYRNLTPKTIYYRIKYGIENLIIWFPTIWRDRDWDEYFLFKILEKKFTHMENHFRKYGNHVGSEKSAHRMMVCKNLCTRLCENEYTTPYDERNKPHLEWFIEKMKAAFHKEPDKRGFITIVRRDEPDEPDNRWINPGVDHEEMLEQQDVDLLCRILSKHSRGWWN